MKKILFFLLLTAFSVSAAVAQCPNCKASVVSNLRDNNSTIGMGLNDGILYLLGAPYLLVGVVGYMWYRNYKAKQLSEETK